jgi:hypothetical protein
VYFILYIGIDLISNHLTGRAAFNNITIYISLILGLLLFYQQRSTIKSHISSNDIISIY